jgi:hypothetical protein
MTRPLCLIGKRFGSLTVQARASSNRDGKARFTCLCDCGRASVVYGRCLVTGHTRSCGCARAAATAALFTTHGMKRSVEYRTWGHIKTRCLNARNPAFPRYGGRGIAVCERWASSFPAFYEDMGPRPSPKHSIDRIDPNGNYEPGNCRWALPGQQNSNRSSVRIVEYQGRRDTIAGWSRQTGIPYLRLRRRIVAGWTPERALTTLEAKDTAVRAAL